MLKKIKIKPESGAISGEEITRNVILELNNICYTYPDGTEGVKDIALEVYKGEILGIIGNNGSGKTTLAKLVLGLLKPSKGKIRLLDIDITKMGTSEIARKIGYVTQDPTSMLFELTVLKECAFGPRCLKLENPEKRAEETLTKLSLVEYREKHPDSLSGGEKRLLTIADILVNEPQVLILDEPEFGLDPKTWSSIANTIAKLKKEGKTTILITHDLAITLFLCDRIAVMNRGKILRIDKPVKIYTDAELLKETFMTQGDTHGHENNKVFSYQNNLLSLPLFDTLKMIKDERTLSEEEFIDSLVSFAEEV